MQINSCRQISYNENTDNLKFLYLCKRLKTSHSENMSGYICVPNETSGGQECSTFWKWISIKVSQEGIWDQSSFFKAFVLTIINILMIPFTVFGPNYQCFHTITSYPSLHSTEVSIKNESTDSCSPQRSRWGTGRKTIVEKVSRGPQLLVCKEKNETQWNNRDKFPWNG